MSVHEFEVKGHYVPEKCEYCGGKKCNLLEDSELVEIKAKDPENVFGFKISVFDSPAPVYYCPAYKRITALFSDQLVRSVNFGMLFFTANKMHVTYTSRSREGMMQVTIRGPFNHGNGPICEVETKYQGVEKAEDVIKSYYERAGLELKEK